MGVNYFLTDFVCGGRSPSRGYLNYIPTVYSADAEHQTLSTSMAAVGLVALATHQPELVDRARAKYSEAIRHVNNALASPVEAFKDSTLMSVISLGVFEHVSNYESWVRHVKGAAALVVARGKAQFTSPAAILMFNQVRADMSIACVQGIQPFPEDMRELQEEASKHIDTSSAFWLLGVLATRCATLFADVAKNNQDIPESAFTPWSHFLREATALQDDFQDVIALLSTQEPYTTTLESSGDRDPMIYNGRYDLYETFWAIRLWNNSRILEIIVCEIVCWLINKILSTELAQPAQDRLNLILKLQETLQIISKRGQDILASVPQGLGYISISKSQNSVDGSPQASVSGGYMLTWCLYTVGKSPVVNHETREWIIKQLQGISKSAGVAMALQLSQDIVKIDRMAN
ncbi:hypothetical protein N7474_000694 [Penicillium riverlandense]|uniref:uncharacterized protein n=1 Tax=Penicillium riverlandense TaxID=1903569 RepID=UPI002547C9B1|nr:uncharacterized protein N7474_000694 [Penicillium riverlandense]KAJ5832383.1 hypothetical protein N7474_000694 [Penicillium riverlandense]